MRGNLTRTLLLPRPEAERRDVSGKAPGGIEGAQEIRASFSAQSQGSQDGVGVRRTGMGEGKR
jgi:hypothetical protein